MNPQETEKTNHKAWSRSMIGFIRERGLEREFQDWCGGFPCPVSHSTPGDAEVRRALEYYANDEHYDGGDVPGHIYVLDDHGRTARAALARTPMSELQALGQEFEAEWGNAVERLGEALFAMSDSLRRSHWIERPENHAIYEKVVAAFQALPSAPSGEGSDHG